MTIVSMKGETVKDFIVFYSIVIGILAAILMAYVDVNVLRYVVDSSLSDEARVSITVLATVTTLWLAWYTGFAFQFNAFKKGGYLEEA